nr:reverse transcriptase domain-containing protein [Tanacetum cinerariifolium]
ADCGVSSSSGIKEEEPKAGLKTSQWNEDLESDDDVDEFIFPKGDKFGDKFDIRLKVMGVRETKEDVTGTSTNPASGSTSFANDVMEQFIVASSVPYAQDVGATAIDISLVDEVVIVESDVEVLAGTVYSTASLATLASAPNAPSPSTSVTSYGPSHLGPNLPVSLSCWPHCFNTRAMAASSLLSSKRSKLKRCPSSFLFLLTMEHLSDGITAFVPYMSIPYLWNGHGDVISFSFVSGRRGNVNQVEEATTMANKETTEVWKHFTEGSSNEGGSRAGLILTSPNNVKFTYALRFEFKALNNVAEYEALLAILRIAKSMETLKRCIKKSDFAWTEEAKKALKDMKKQMAELPTLAAPIQGETLIMYLSAAEEAISAVLLTEQGEKQIPAKKVLPSSPSGSNHGPTDKAGIVKNKELREVGKLGHRAWDRSNGNIRGRGRHVDDADKRISRKCHTPKREGKAQRLRARQYVILKGTLYRRCSMVNKNKNDEGHLLSLDLLEERRELAAIAEEKHKRTLEKYYNAKVQNTILKPKDLVY